MKLSSLAKQSKNQPWRDKCVWGGRPRPPAFDLGFVFDSDSEASKIHVETAASAVPRSEASGANGRAAPTERPLRNPHAGPSSLSRNHPQYSLSRRSLRILIRISLECLLALLRTEGIFLSRKLRLEFHSLLVHFHSTNRVNRHDSS